MGRRGGARASAKALAALALLLLLLPGLAQSVAVEVRVANAVPVLQGGAWAPLPFGLGALLWAEVRDRNGAADVRDVVFWIHGDRGDRPVHGELAWRDGTLAHYHARALGWAGHVRAADVVARDAAGAVAQAELARASSAALLRAGWAGPP
ncbi:MAG TPA: hypothetical protein VGR28_00850, partial [Candidatus Thermoplasmatota archaeon]|nr:hypothetical protein [Candidatus Thermoplasmatota archaeon]